MKTRRIELEGSAGEVTIQRQDGTIRIDSTLHRPTRHDQAYLTWNLPITVSDDDLFEVAEIVQQRCDGVRGTNSDIHDYYREMQRFQA